MEDGKVGQTHNHELMIAALKLPKRVGAFPIFFSGVNNPVVILLKTPTFGSGPRELFLLDADPRLLVESDVPLLDGLP
jgi:hypothetical protein